MVGNNPPLAMLLIPGGPWRAIQTAISARGVPADIVVFLRDPTPEEFDEVVESLSCSFFRRVYYLRDLVPPLPANPEGVVSPFPTRPEAKET